MQRIERSLAFTGPYGKICTDYISENRSLGYKFKIDEVYLRQFDNFSIGKVDVGVPITKELFDEWTQKRSYESITTQRLRYDVLTKLCKYLNSRDHKTYIGFFPLKRNIESGFTPYIFSTYELGRIFSAADSLKPNPWSKKIHLVYPVLLRMLYSCGLRLSEALNLLVSDVDLKKGTISVRKTKFNKSRLLPLSDSMLHICKEYAEKVYPLVNNNGYFFPAPDGGPYAECTIYTRYRHILFMAGISHGGRGKGPRLHDLRHTFAVHSLKKLVDEGQDVYVTLPILSGYLGHKNIYSTQLYLRLTAEAFPELTVKFEQNFPAIFPEVLYE